MLRSLLRFPSVYSWFGKIVGGDSRERYAREFLHPESGQRMLDIGCGPADILAHLPTLDYLGIDISADYVRRGRQRFGDRGEFRCEDIFTTQVAAPGTYDLVAATGVIHHLDDDRAHRLMAVAAEAVASGGRVVTLDPCWVKGQSRLARVLLSLDRGEHVRATEAYEGLARQYFAHVETKVVHDLLRIPFTLFIMTCTKPLRGGNRLQRSA